MEAITVRRLWIMLVLTRRLGQTLTIGVNVTVTVLEVRGNQVRIGIDAPSGVAIHRAKATAKTGGVRRMPAAGR
jgi:carbon storage regulator